jgi:spermidine/putrescine-binding protein
MLAKLMAGGSQFDLVVASDYMVESLVKQDLIQHIDLGNVPNFKNLDESTLNLPFDPGNKYSIPYMSSNACIAVNTSKVKTPIQAIRTYGTVSLKIPS